MGLDTLPTATVIAPKPPGRDQAIAPLPVPSTVPSPGPVEPPPPASTFTKIPIPTQVGVIGGVLIRIVGTAGMAIMPGSMNMNKGHYPEDFPGQTPGLGDKPGAPIDDPNKRSPLRIALGVEHDLINFSIQTRSMSYKGYGDSAGNGWGDFAAKRVTQGAYMAAIIAMAEAHPDLTFHFNLSLRNGGRIEKNMARFKGAITTAEFMVVTLRYMDRTTFYKRSGSIYKPTQPILR
jgi:hypothetical protein